MDNAYNEGHVELFNQYHRNDEPGRLFAQDLAKVQSLVKKAGDGGINLRRGQIQQQINEALAMAVHRHHEARRQQADALRERYETHVKNRSKPSSTDRLADFHETQARIKAMTTSALETRYVYPTTARKEHTFKATVFKSPVELDLVLAELESRGSNAIDVLRESMAATPPQCYRGCTSGTVA